MKLSVPVAKVPSAIQVSGPNWRMPDADCDGAEVIAELAVILIVFSVVI